MREKMFTFVTSILLLSSSVFMAPAALGSSAQFSIGEQEPNNGKAEAQPINLNPGQTVLIAGTVARGDAGTLVEELARLSFGGVSPNDRMEDWFRIDVVGSKEFSVELSWPGSARIDGWIFSDIDGRIYSDGLVSRHAPLRIHPNPQSIPNELYHVYSDRAGEPGTGGPVVVPAVSRYYIAVSNVDDGVSPPTSYLLRLSSPALQTSRNMKFDTSGPGYFATLFATDTIAPTVLALQRITPPEYPARLDRVELLQFALQGFSQVGQSLDLVVRVDPQGTGDPAKSTQVLRRKVTIQSLEAVNSYGVGDANLSIPSGDVYVGFEIPRTPTDLHLPFDIDKAGFGRTFISTNGGLSYNLLWTTSVDINIPLVANAGISAELTIRPGAAAAASTSIPDVTVRPAVLSAADVRAVKRITPLKPE